MDKEQFSDFLIRHGVIGFKPEGITLKSGKTSYWYVNCRTLSQHFSVLEEAARFVITFLSENDLRDAQIVGVPEGATLLGLEVQRQLVAAGAEDQILSPRVKPKEHGDPANRFWTNGITPKRIILLEDVTTTGGSAIEAAEKFRAMDIEVVGIVGLVNRMQKNAEGISVKDNMVAHDLHYRSLVDANDVLAAALKGVTPEDREKIAALVREEYNCEYKDQDNPITF